MLRACGEQNNGKNTGEVLKVRVFSTIHDVPQSEWNELLFDRGVAMSIAFWRIIEQSRLNDFDYRHAIFYDAEDRPMAIASFYSVTSDLAIFAGKRARRLVQIVRRWWPNFFKLRVLECGTPITISSPPFSTEHAGAAIDALARLLLDTARRERQSMIVVRDFEPNAQILHADFERNDYHWVDCLPNTYLPIRWPTIEAYEASLKSYYRSKLRRHLRKNAERKIRHELVEDFAALAPVLCAQWLNVHRQADEFQREVLTPAFYRAFSDELGQRSRALLFYREDELIGHALLLEDGDMLRWLYFGRKEATNDSLYLYVAHAVIATAIKLGAKRLEMGLTTYSIKQDLGAEIVPIKLALRSPTRLGNLFVDKTYPLFNKLPRLRAKNVFIRESPA